MHLTNSEIIKAARSRRGARAWSRLSSLVLAIGLFASSTPVQAVNYSGNGNSDWGGAIGNGTLSITDDGTTISGALTIGSTINNALVIYIQAGSGGFASTAGFNDAQDPLRKTISGYNGPGEQSVLTFAGGFAPNYAIALQPDDGIDFGGLWQLTNGGNNSLPFIQSINLNPTGTGAPGIYTFSFPASAIGLTPGVRADIQLFGTYISDSGYRSPEAIAGNLSGAAGWNPFTNTAYATYTFDAGAPVTYPVTFQVDMTVQIDSGAFNPNNGDTVSAAGTFQTNVWVADSFILSPTLANTNIYTGTYSDGNLLGTIEQYKFAIATNGGGFGYEYTENRSFTLQSGGQTLPLVYYADVTPDSGIPTRPLTFQLDMSAQIRAGLFHPETGDTVEARGTFQTPVPWTGGFTLTNDPGASNTDLYTGTYPDGNYPGTYEQYKFVIVSGPNTTYESTGNRVFTAPSTGQTFPVAFFNNASNVCAVTFQVDMSVQAAIGHFDPNNDTVECRGSFNNWNENNANPLVLTNDPNGSNPNLYVGVTNILVPPTGIFYLFWDSDAMAGHNGYEWPASTSGGNRSYTLPNSTTTVVIAGVYYSDQVSTANFLTEDTLVTFTVNMTGAVTTAQIPFNPNSHNVFLNGDWIPWWAWDSLLQPWLPYQLTNNPVGSELYSCTLPVPKGTPLALTYKFSINGSDNELPLYVNHIRYVRTLRNYEMALDKFGTQVTEPAFGQLAVGAASGGQVPVSWLGQPGVHLQTKASLSTGSWQDLPQTDGSAWANGYTSTNGFVSVTNYPASAPQTFFRLIQP